MAVAAAAGGVLAWFLGRWTHCLAEGWLLWAWFWSRAPQGPQGPGSALPPVLEQLHPREADAPGAVCIHLPYVQARLAGPVLEPAPNRSRSLALSLLQGTLLAPLWGRGCRHPEVESHPPSLDWAAPAVGKHHAFVGCLPSPTTQWGSRGEGKREGESSHPLHPRSFSFHGASAQPAAWSGPQLPAYLIASARLPIPPRRVAFRLETPDLRVWSETDPPEQGRKELGEWWKALREVGNTVEPMLVSNEAVSCFTPYTEKRHESLPRTCRGSPNKSPCSSGQGSGQQNTCS